MKTLAGSWLVKVFGWRVALIHGDSTTLDRWMWLRQRINFCKRNGRVLDIGCGTGAFTIGLSMQGYAAIGLSWDTRNQSVAELRAKRSGATTATFQVCDVRLLDQRVDLLEAFDLVVLCEVIEHILDDMKLMRDATACLKAGGRLLLTTPNKEYRPITREDGGPFTTEETGWHVRKGYSEEDIRRLCAEAGLTVEGISYCSGVLSQKVTWIYRVLGRSVNTYAAWLVVLPLRILPPLFDRLITSLLDWPEYSICLEASKSAKRT